MGYSRHFQSPSWPQSTLLHQNRSNFSQSTSISMRTFSTFFFTRNPGRCFLFQDGRQYRMLSLPATSSTIGYFLIHGSTERPDTDDDHQVLQEPSAGAVRQVTPIPTFHGLHSYGPATKYLVMSSLNVYLPTISKVLPEVLLSLANFYWTLPGNFMVLRRDYFHIFSDNSKNIIEIQTWLILIWRELQATHCAIFSRANKL